MKSMVKRWGILLCGAAVCLMVMLAAMPGRSEAAPAAKPVCAKSQTVYLIYSNRGGSLGIPMLEVPSSHIYIKNLSPKAKVTNVRSSNKYVNAYKRTDVDLDAISLDTSSYIKPGAKTTVSFNVKQNGKTYKLSCKVTFKNRPNIIKSFKVGNQNYSALFKKGIYSSSLSASGAKKPGGSKGKLSIKMAPGYKPDEIQVRYKKNGKSSLKMVKNGMTISLKDLDDITIMYCVTKKPANYKAISKDFFGMVKSPLHEVIILDFE